MDVTIALPCAAEQEVIGVIREYSDILRKAGAKLLRRSPIWARDAHRLEFDIRTDDLRVIAESLEAHGVPLFIMDDEGVCTAYYKETSH